jgi:hypothetical protein
MLEIRLWCPTAIARRIVFFGGGKMAIGRTAWAIPGVCLAAGVAAGAATPAAAKDEVRKARDQAAEEFVAATYPMTDERKARAQTGKVAPYCQMTYPELATPFASGAADPQADAEALAVRQAVDMMVVRQNLTAAGMDETIAKMLSGVYRTARESYDRKTPEERTAARQSGEDPDSLVVKAANGLPKFLHQPQLVASTCGMMTRSGNIALQTPYRFVTDPPGANVYLISEFSFRVCQLHLQDPYSKTDCRAWTNVPEGTVRKVNGIYNYSAEWPDGARHRDRATLEYVGFDTTDVVIKPAP